MMLLPAVQFTIPGRIGGKQRHRSFMQKGAMVHKTPKQTESQEGIVAHLAALAKRDQHCAQLVGAVHLQIAIFRHAPPSWSKKRQAAALWITGKPDVDNTVKLIADGLNHSGVWQDDSQIAKLTLSRCYCADMDECVIVTAAQLEDVHA